MRPETSGSSVGRISSRSELVAESSTTCGSTSPKGSAQGFLQNGHRRSGLRLDLSPTQWSRPHAWQKLVKIGGLSDTVLSACSMHVIRVHYNCVKERHTQ